MFKTILLQASGEGGGLSSLILFGGIAIVFYFFMIRPQQKKQKDQKKFIEEIKRGDNVVTIGGIHGKVLTVEDDTLSVEIDKGVKIKVQKSSISLDATKPPETKQKKS
ncbi:preprotein translocase subunit YajC [Fulvivirga sp. M361]|uniref:preprotein translocase subunit YajC n=1 Tax=Fulvivirga sp. M361 TaxID=2594266 RepID=UPI001179ABF8|nr:preprotein translocase subunit YajC [Fulvivirga sp. M361]TRX48903.1 preprotein translocase subunit YajC [Fulvivirga sp. M361]